MERVAERLAVASRALRTLKELVGLGESISAVERDAAIQRFEYTFEAVWKAAQLYLREREGLDVGSPKGAIRAFLEVGLLAENQVQLGLEMTDDRNLTVHTYNEALSKTIYRRLADYARLMGEWLAGMEEGLSGGKDFAK